ncbi:MAG: tail fiber domain-containing protein [Phycisphaeraceae bacterium]|nr:tail fiber domain-containing protein [Phycisphaeraceae bacterium]
MRMRNVTLFGVVAACVASQAMAQISYTSQVRKVMATGPGGGVPQSAQAPDFGDFDKTVTSPGVANGGSSTAYLSSSLGSLALRAYGSASISPNGLSQFGTASSSATISFKTSTNCTFEMIGGNTAATVTLVGPGVNIVHSTTVPLWNNLGTFQANQTYTLTATCAPTSAPTSQSGSFLVDLYIRDITPAAQGGAFTYQGVLRSSGGQFINSATDLKFSLFPASAGGLQIGPTLAKNNVAVQGGVFTTSLDFGATFDGGERWMEIEVSNPAGAGVFTTIPQRVKLDSTPYASYALSAKTAPWSGLTGVPANVSGAFSPWTSVGGGINTTNNVSIGTPAFSPADQLHLMSAASNRLTVQSTGTGSAGIRTKTAGREYYVGNDNNDQWELFDNTAAAYRLRVMPGGNVGIGAAVPELKLSVDGGIQLTTGNYLAFGTVGNGTGTAENTDLVAFSRTNLASGGSNSTELRLIIGDDNVAGPSQDYFTIGTIPGGVWNPTISFRSDGVAAKPGGGSWANISDPRTKHDVAPLHGTLDRLLSLRGYQYFYNDDEIRKGRALPGVQIGLMADEVERVFPDWVTRDRDGMRMVTERSTTALMVEALRDLRTEKDAQVESLRKENELLKARLERIEKMLAPAGAEH